MIRNPQGHQREKIRRVIMSVPEPLNPRKPSARRLARNFTPNTPFHHPHLDPSLNPEDLHQVPPALFPGRKLNWELPRLAVTNLHVVLKLTDDPNELLDDFHDKIPQIDEVLRLWGEKKGASPTTTSEAQVWTRISGGENRGWTSAAQEDEDSNLDTPGRADVIHLTDAMEDSVEQAEDSSVPSNLRTIDWSDFDGSYVHLEDVEPKVAALPTEQSSNLSEHSMSTPSNLRVTEWLADKQYTDLASEAHNPEPDSDRNPSQIGPYETFWMNHDPYGPRLALATDEDESSSSTSEQAASERQSLVPGNSAP